jgi:poly(3-hydroxyalkanoate) synthetase
VWFEGELDERNWVWDFGGMKRAKGTIDGMNPKAWMDYMLDHTTIVAEDDPYLESFKLMEENELIQLIQYAPSTPDVFEIPLLIIPPWINKYYILDLSEENSLIKWLVENNFQVFLVSWVNPTKELADKDFEDYLHQGVIEPLEHIQKLGFEKVNAAGYCIGGTLLAIALSYYKAHNSNIINSIIFNAMNR